MVYFILNSTSILPGKINFATAMSNERAWKLVMLHSALLLLMLCWALGSWARVTIFKRRHSVTLWKYRYRHNLVTFSQLVGSHVLIVSLYLVKIWLIFPALSTISPAHTFWLMAALQVRRLRTVMVVMIMMVTRYSRKRTFAKFGVSLSWLNEPTTGFY